MAHELRCLSCGHENTSEASICSQCNFPLRDGAPAPALTSEPVPAATQGPGPASAPVRPPVVAAPKAPEAEPRVEIRRVRPIRPRRPADAQAQLQTQLIVVLGGMAVVIAILSVAWQGYQKNNNPAPAPVAGASPQQLADIALATNQLKADSTNINAQIALANTLYDTANWSEAILHYKSALRLDPTRVTTVVDLGVCYYSLSDMLTAESLFTQALTLDPRQPVALFNLGIVSEGRGEPEKALQYFQRALQAGPPQGMGESINQAIGRVTGKRGRPAPPNAGPGGGF